MMFRTAFIFSFFLFFSGTSLWANWKWQLPAKRYKSLPVFQRSQYNKAKKLFESKQYRAAAAEFEKFKVQFEDSPILPYVIFMRGYSLHNAKDRNRAIKVYNEVLDYFGDEIQDAAPALYFIGRANFDNGDKKKGMEAMKEMAEDEDYSQHALAAGALNTLASNHLKNKEVQTAVKYWKQIVTDFGQKNKTEANNARWNVVAVYIKNKDYSGYESWMISEEQKDNEKHKEWVARYAWDVAWQGFRHGWDKYTNFNKAEKKSDMQAFVDYFNSRKDLFLKNKREWEFYHRAVYFGSQRHYVKKDFNKLMAEISKWMDGIKDKKDRDKKLAWISDRLRDAGKYSEANVILAKMSNRPQAKYKEYQILERRSMFKECIDVLNDLEKMGDKYYEATARSSKAYVYHKRLRDYDKAIKIYQEIDKPPGTLWNIQDCHYRAGRLKDALTVLSEIQNSFPKHASNALWHKAQYYHAAGKAKLAIKSCRHIMLAYKKSSHSSNAHQMLENYGINTGGGVVEED